MVHYTNYIHLGLFAIALVFSFFIIKPLLLAVFLGALLAYLFRPFYKKVDSKIKRPVASSFIICFVVIILVLLLGAFMVNSLIRESYTIFIFGKQRLATGIFQYCDNSFCQGLKGLGQVPEINYQLQELLKKITSWIVESGSSLLIGIPRIVLNLFVIFFTMFYFLKDGPKFIDNFSLIMGIGDKRHKYVKARMEQILGGVIYGYFVVALIQGALGALGFLILGISSPLFWGLVMALFALIPFIGTWVIWFPAAIIMFLDGIFQNSTWMMIKGIILLVYGLLIISGIDNILKPKLIGDKAKIHPAIALLGVLGGFFFFGPIGVLAGPLILALTTVFIDVYVYEIRKHGS